MFFGRSWDEWIEQYAQSHQHPVNRFCHTIGIPLIALSLPLFLVAPFVHGFWDHVRDGPAGGRVSRASGGFGR